MKSRGRHYGSRRGGELLEARSYKGKSKINHKIKEKTLKEEGGTRGENYSDHRGMGGGSP